jgi:hypothetical protein
MKHYTKDLFLAWFVGIVDGEGHLGLFRNGNNFRAELSIRMRDDDEPLVRYIHNTLGLGKYYHVSGEKAGRGDLVSWRVTAKDELLKLLDIFDNFPLQSKKSKQYPIWSRAIREIAKNHTEQDLDKIANLRTRLMSLRQYTFH